MKLGKTLPIALMAGIAILVATGHTEDRLPREVMEAERGFAQTMADRNVEKFASYVAEEAVFFGRKGAIRGRAAVLEAWKPFFEGPKAPFSWRPEHVEVLTSGTLALSSGPVHDPGGRQIGTFNSIWRLERDGRWRVVFDKGCPVCDSLPPPKGE